MAAATHTRVDLAVVGAGVIGLATAWRAAQAGMRVCVLDREQPGAGASSVAVGILTPSQLSSWHGERGRWYARAIGEWQRLAEELGHAATGYGERGVLRLYWDDTGRAELHELAALHRDAGVTSHLLDARDVAALEPNVAPVAGALHEPHGASAEPARVVAALVAACERAGVELRSGCEASGLLEAAGSCVGVRCGETSLAATNTVVAAGAWTGSLPWLAAAGVPAIAPVRGQVVELAFPHGAPCRSVVYAAPGSIAPRTDGRVAIGATLEPEAGFDVSVTDEGIAQVLAEATRAIPGIGAGTVVARRAGLRPLAPGEEPVVGPTAMPGSGSRGATTATASWRLRSWRASWWRR